MPLREALPGVGWHRHADRRGREQLQQNYSVGSTILVSNVGVGGYNGTFTVTAVTNNTVSYSDPNTGLASSGGGTSTVVQAFNDPSPAGLTTADYNAWKAGCGRELVATASGGPGSLTAAVDSASESGSTVSLTTTVNNGTGGGFTGYQPGDKVNVAGVSTAGYNGTFTILTATPTTLTYTDSTSGLAAGSGGTTALGAVNPERGLSCGDGTSDCNDLFWGSWGYQVNAGQGYSHTYVSRAAVTDVCVNVYDPHGGGNVGSNKFQVPGNDPGDISVDGDNDNSVQTNSYNATAGSNCISFLLASPTLTTSLSATSSPVGTAVHDTATLTGASGNIAGDTVSYTVYPTVADCTNSTGGTSEGTVTIGAGPGYAIPTSNSFTPTATGTYFWQATYSGDAHNSQASSSCSSEELTVTKATPAISTTASATVALTGSVHDTATLSGASSNASGTITFNLYGPSSTAVCTTSIFTTTATVSGNNPYTSASFTPTAPGTYYWTASYGGDTNNTAVSEACGGAGESVIVSAPTATINTTASATVVLGAGTVHDTAVLAGGVSPTGTITFNLYGPSSTAVCGASIFTATVPVSGNNSYTSANYTPTAAGTYYWTASYSGDTNNTAVSEACGGAGESVIVSPATPTINTTASASVVLGAGSVHDTAVLAGGVSTPTGTITFNLYGPSSTAVCAASIFTATVPVSGNNSYTSANYTPTAAGTYYWTASYSGDTNNNSVSEACNGAGESVIVCLRSTPSISTTNVGARCARRGDSPHDTATSCRRDRARRGRSRSSCTGRARLRSVGASRSSPRPCPTPRNGVVHLGVELHADRGGHLLLDGQLRR